MDIGTAKPTVQQRQAVPHHLIDVTDPMQPWSLAIYRREALRVISEIHARRRLPLLVGGTGQYFAALLEGWSPPVSPPDRQLRDELQGMAQVYGPAFLWERLKDLDPATAARIDPRNVRRVIRALEIYEITGIVPSEQRFRAPPPFSILRVGLNMPRRELYDRLDRRLDRMMEVGFVDEVRRLLEAGVDPDSPAMSAIGYRQIAAHLRGEMSLDASLCAIRRASRQFVRRQANWFKLDDPKIVWYLARPGVDQAITQHVRTWLASLKPQETSSYLSQAGPLPASS
jgi:tRNA dimethylallyltransferase